MQKIFSNKILTIVFSAILILFFFYGFFTLENSAGAGDYDGDLKKIWNNLELFKTGILSNLSNLNYDDSRTPLSYILHIKINPFINSIDEFRNSVFFLSLLIPVLLFYSLKINFKETNKLTLLVISLIITLSPYFRTSSFWGLGENYSLICILISYLLLEKYRSLKEKSDILLENTIIFLITLISSLIVYFDQKLLIFPLIIFFHLLTLETKKNNKYLATLYFFIFSLPFIYLIFEWNSILPPAATESRILNKKIDFFNFGYSSSMISFYLFPFLFLKKDKLIDIKNKLIKKDFIFLIFLSFIYFFFLIYYGDFYNLPILGKGFLHKLLLYINNENIRLIFTLIGFFISFVIIYIYIDKFYDLVIVLYFLLTSIFIHPFLQEYIDPIFFILILTYFRTKIFITKNRTIFLFSYFLIFLIGTQIYYCHCLDNYLQEIFNFSF